MTRPPIVVNDQNLDEHVAREMAAHGNACDLNHLDVSRVRVFDWLFQDSPFVGDISRWDVSKAVRMQSMFQNSMFDGDISQWRIPVAKNITHMFYGSQLTGDLSDWRLRVDGVYAPMFHAQFEGRVPRVLYDNPHESYPAMFKDKDAFQAYAARMPFFGMHADLLIVDPKNCPWASSTVVQWAHDHQEMARSLGLDYESVRALMLSTYAQLHSPEAAIALPADFPQMT